MSEQPKGHGWLPQEEWERLVRVWRTRANEEFERAERAEAAYERAHQQANDALNEAAQLAHERDKQKQRASALEWTLREVRAMAQHYQNTRPHPVRWAHVQAMCDGALTDQPAQDGGRDAGCRVEPGGGEVLLKIDGLPTISICADDVEGFGYDLNEAADGTKPQSGVTVRLQSDQPTDAGEVISSAEPATPDVAENCETGPISSPPTGHPDCCARTRAEERERCAQEIELYGLKRGRMDGALANSFAAAIRRTNGGDT